MVTMPGSTDRYEPLPSLLELPSFLARKIPPERRRIVLLVAVLVLAVVGAGAVAGISALRGQQRAEDASQERQAALNKRQLLARYAFEARPRFGRGPASAGLSGPAARTARHRLVAGLEAALLADARTRRSLGAKRRTYHSAVCSGYPKSIGRPAPQDDLGRRTAVMECLAVAAEVKPSEVTTGSMIGQPFRALVDFEHGRYSWCQIAQTPGEKAIPGKPVVKVPAACGGN